MSEVAAIVLAAGRGTRFGPEPKLLAPFRGKPLVRWVAEAALGSCAAPVIVVVGDHAPQVEAALTGLGIEFRFNPAFAAGLATSLKVGFEALPAEADAAVVLLADMPLVGAAIIDRLVGEWHDRGGPAALVPVTGGRRSNPVVLARRLEAEILRLEGDAGAGALLRSRSDVEEYPLEDPALLRDVDTVEALSRLE